MSLALWGRILPAEAPRGPLITWVLNLHRTEPKCPAERDGDADEKITGHKKGKE